MLETGLRLQSGSSFSNYGYKTMKHLDLIAMVLLLVGGINWGLVGAFNYNLVSNLLGDSSMVTRVVYGLVGLCAVYNCYKFMQKKAA